MSAKSGVPGDKSITLDINLLGRDYKVACKEHERAELMDAVAYLDAQMREIRGGGKIAGVDRIAVMAALNITNETQSTHGRYDNELLDVWAYGRRYALGIRYRL